MASRPTLIVVTGPSGFGKTTLAHALASAIPCIAICRDEIKEGMVHAVPGFEAAPGDALTKRSTELFFDVVESLLRGGVTVVAEAAYQHARWAWFLNRLKGLANIVVVQCHLDAAEALARMTARGIRRAHADAQVLGSITAADIVKFTRLAFDAPSIDVDTTDGYAPDIDQVVAFIEHSSSTYRR